MDLYGTENRWLEDAVFTKAKKTDIAKRDSHKCGFARKLKKQKDRHKSSLHKKVYIGLFYTKVKKRRHRSVLHGSFKKNGRHRSDLYKILKNSDISLIYMKIFLKNADIGLIYMKIFKKCRHMCDLYENF